jgi:hypothetical protein
MEQDYRWHDISDRVREILEPHLLGREGTGAVILKTTASLLM